MVCCIGNVEGMELSVGPGGAESKERTESKALCSL